MLRSKITKQNLGGTIITGLRNLLKDEYERLKKIIKITEDRLKISPEGTLRLGKSNGTVQYYHCNKNESSCGKYISKENCNLAARLAQKAYDERVVKLAKRRTKQIETLLSDYDEKEIEEIYLQEHPERQKLILPVENTFQQKLEEWLLTSYMGKPFKGDMPEIYTNSGIRVRSKSEKIMADYFDSIQLPYKYECPLHLDSGMTVYPDFTFLSPAIGKEIYWEHEGMMDNAEYARAAVRKIDTYQKNNIFIGERLIVTFETTMNSIDMSMVKTFCWKYLC